ncbi:MAG: DUF2723 domain-containing protein [Chloroflexota bacterium]
MQQTFRKSFRWVPGLVLGLFCSRLAHEWLHSGGLGVVVSTSLILSLVTAVSLRAFPFPQTWPALILLVYIFYPEANPGIALTAAAVALIVWGNGRFPIKQRHAHHAAMAAGGIGFILLYIFTLAPDLLPADNGEFQLIAAQLGVAHPPGFTLYTLLAHLMTRLPLGATPAYQINLLSAFSSSATLLLVYLSVYRLTKRPLAGIIAIIALGTATTFWAQATTANIRSLTALFAAAMFYTLIRYAQEHAAHTPQAADRYLVWFALAAGLGLTHHVSLAFIAVVCALFILLIDRTFLTTPRRWLRPFLAAAIGLLPLLYLPLRAYAEVRGASPELATVSGFLNHALARGFRGDFFYFITPGDLWQRTKVMGNVLTFQFAPWLLVGMGIGFVLLLWRERRLALLLGGSFIIHTFITATYRAPQTVEYMLPAYVPLGILLGYAVGQWDFAAHRSWQTAVSNLFTAGMLVTAVAQGVQHYPSYAYLHTDTTARDYAQAILTAAPADSVILADWHWVTPLWYLQEIEAQRPDVSIRYVYPEADLYADTWAQRIAAAVTAGHNVIATHYDENAYRNLPPAEPLHDAYLYRQEPLTTLPAGFTPLDVTLGGTVHLVGYQLAADTVEIGEETAVTLAWESMADLPAPLSLFAHGVDMNGRIIAQDDQPAPPQATGITLTQLRLTPRPGTAPGTYAIGVGAYSTAPLLDEQDAARTAVATLTVQAMSRPPYTANPRHRPLAAAGRTLIGYDWDTTLPDQSRLYLHWQTAAGYITEVQDNLTPEIVSLPPFVGAWGITQSQWNLPGKKTSNQYVPLGQGIVWHGGLLTDLESPVQLTPLFSSSRVVTRDLVISTRLIGYQADGFQWAWTEQEDGVPAMGAVPTLKWIAGSQVHDLHTIPIHEAAQPGQLIGATLRVYDAFTNRPLPILDERITNQFPWIPLGQMPLPAN